MAKVDLNPIFDQVSGKVGDLVLKRYRNGVVMARAGASERPLSEAQIAQQERFRAATLYSKLALMDPAVRDQYRTLAVKRGLPLMAVMVADFFNGPTIVNLDAAEYHGRVGDRITVVAKDDFSVTKVEVVIKAGTVVVEQGEAVETPAGSGQYYYTATQAAPSGTPLTITATATDRPGNTTSQSVTQ